LFIVWKLDNLRFINELKVIFFVRIIKTCPDEFVICITVRNLITWGSDMFDMLTNILELAFSSVWVIVGVVVGLLAAVGVWKVVDFQYRGIAAAFTYIIVFILCVLVGKRFEKGK